MSFKDQLAKDVTRVFLNLKEFAEKHIIDGVEFDCILKTDNSVQSSGDQLGVYIQKTVLIINESLVRKPTVNQRLMIDNKYYYVEGVEPKHGILNIILTANKSL